MRIGISITLKPADRHRLKVLAQDRNAPHKHVWRAEIVLLSADGVGTRRATATPIRSSENRSPSRLEPVSGMPKRKLENGERRLAPQSHRIQSRKSGNLPARDSGPPASCGNVGSSRTARNRMVETELAGWGGRIRTHKCGFQN
jgi:hypothetical protein